MPARRSGGKSPPPVVYDPSLRPVMRAVLMPLVLFCLLLLAVTTALFNHLQSYAVEQRAEATLSDLEFRLWRAIESQSDTLTAIEELIAERPELQAMLQQQNRSALLQAFASYYRDLRRQLGITHFYFHAPDLTNIARLHRPARFGDQINRITALGSRDNQATVSGMELGVMGTFTLRVVTPVRTGQDVLGYIELGTEVEDIAAMATGDTGVHWAAFIYKRLVRALDWQEGMDMLGRRHDWQTFNDVVLINESGSLPASWQPYMNQNPDGYKGPLPSFDERSWFTGQVSFPDVSGRDVGYSQFFIDVSHYRDQVATTAYIVYAGIVVLILVAAAFLYLLLRRADQNLSFRLHQLHNLAFTDPLTLLPNRELFADRLSHALNVAGRSGRHVAVMFLDLDDFKSINDSLGHSAGDELLVDVARRLNACIREGDTLARQGGDEFALVVENLSDEHQVVAVADHIIEALKAPVVINQQEVSTGVSIGISMYPQNGQTPEELMRNADAAMYMAKASGKNCFAFYTSDLTVSAIQKITLLAELKKALSQGSISLNYQPVVDSDTGRQVGFEALARWEHPQQGFISPRTFIDLAEDCGLIHELGHYLIDQILAQIRQWLDRGLHPGRISINVSAAQVEQPDFAGFLDRQLSSYRIPPGMIALEITESALMTKIEHSVEQLNRLGRMGISVWIDDFGTGYSSLAYLKQLPIDVLKIDASFVQDIPGDADDLAIVRAIISMAQALNIEVLAEGVETEEQAACLKAMECHFVQGYWFSRPLTPAQASQRLLEPQYYTL